MKNFEEFRSTVFEKAKHFEKKRKARNKKIIEAASLCSLCVVIGISAYFGFGNADFRTDEKVAEGVLTAMYPSVPDVNNEADGNHTGAPMETTTAAEFATTTVATTEMTQKMTTSVAATLATGTVPSTTVSETTASSVEETITATLDASTPTDTYSFDSDPTQTTTSDGFFHYGGFLCEGHSEESSPTLYIFEDLPAFTQAMDADIGKCLSEEDKASLEDAFTASFFEDKVLVVLHAFDSDVWTFNYEAGVFTISPSMQNSTDRGVNFVMFYAFSKDTFDHAALILPDHEG